MGIDQIKASLLHNSGCLCDTCDFKRIPLTEFPKWLERARKAEDQIDVLTTKLKCSTDQIVSKIQAIQTHIAQMEQAIEGLFTPPTPLIAPTFFYWDPTLLSKMPKEMAEGLSKLWWEWDQERAYKRMVGKTKELDLWFDKVLSLCRKRSLTMYSFNGTLVVTGFELYKCPELWYKGRAVTDV